MWVTETVRDGDVDSVSLIVMVTVKRDFVRLKVGRVKEGSTVSVSVLSREGLGPLHDSDSENVCARDKDGVGDRE